MPQRYVVPQFIDAEDKIMGPITTRQFLILLVTAFLMFLAFKLFDFTLFIIVALGELALGGTLAFFKVNGQPVHYFILNLIQTTRRPRLRVWDKELTTDELRTILRQPPPVPPKARVVKAAIEESHLAELTLVVNTGGVYTPEE